VAGVDGGRSCLTPTACPCFANDECPATHRCQSNGLDEAFCLVGARGTGLAGTGCTTELDCASALCVEGRDGGFRCSRLCAQPSDCPPELPRCLTVFGQSFCARSP
jgi:hypothetical protein